MPKLLPANLVAIRFSPSVLKIIVVTLPLKGSYFPNQQSGSSSNTYYRRLHDWLSCGNDFKIHVCD